MAYVSWFDAARFCNWLHNGQGSGSTGTGAYTLTGAMSGIVLRNSDARFWIPTEDEWYKSAYYDPTKGGTGGYWLDPTRSDTLGGNTIGNLNSANYWNGELVGSVTSSAPSGNALTDVGAYGAHAASFYGTNDQGGTCPQWRWKDASMSIPPSPPPGSRSLRGDRDGRTERGLRVCNTRTCSRHGSSG